MSSFLFDRQEEDSIGGGAGADGHHGYLDLGLVLQLLSLFHQTVAGRHVLVGF